MFSNEKLCLSKARPGNTPGSLSVHWIGAVDFQQENYFKRNSIQHKGCINKQKFYLTYEFKRSWKFYKTKGLR